MSAKELAARAAAVGSRRQRPDTKDESPAPQSAKVRTDPVRLSTDLSPNAYRDLIAYCADLAVQAGKARVPHTLVLRKLIDELQSDPALRERIAAVVLAEIRN